MAEVITYLPVGAIREHPDNPRKHWEPGDLMDLAESIKAQGVLQPVVVRPLINVTDSDTERYELVFGHRRLRACQSLPEYSDEGLGLRIPAIVRAMNDEEVALAQVAENLQRKDVTALEEADNLVRLHRAYGMSADTIAEKIGKSRSYVYGKLKLSRATDAVRKAVISDGLSPEVALEIARLHPKLQDLGLKRARPYPEADWFSFRSAKSMLRDMLQEHELGGALFDPADGDLVLSAPACGACPRRAGNDVDLVAAGVPADVCTDGECFAAKQRAHSVKVLPQLRAEGLTVITADEAADMKLFGNRPSGWPQGYYGIEYGAVACGNPPGGQYRQLGLDEALAELAAGGVAMDPPHQVAVVNPHTGIVGRYITVQSRQAIDLAWNDMVRRAAAASTPGSAARARDGGPTIAPRRDPMDDWTYAERVMAGEESERVLDAVLRAMLRRPRTTDDLRLVLHREIEVADDLCGRIVDLMGLGDEARAAALAAEAADDDKFSLPRWWADRLARLSADELGHLVVGLALDELVGNVTAYGGRGPAARAVAIAASFGVDVLEVAAQPKQTDEGGGAAAAAPAASGLSAAKLAQLAKSGVKYLCPDTHSTWTGRGLQPAWLKAALANGKKLADFVLPTGKEQTDKAGGAGQEQSDEAGGVAAGQQSLLTGLTGLVGAEAA